MKIHELQPAPGSKKEGKRLGRGTGSGLGKTSGKGHKGQNARSGGGVRPGFEGGQMPLMRRVPKFGFTNNFKKVYSTVNVESLNSFKDGTVVNEELLAKERIIGKREQYGLKVLGNGQITKKLTVECAKITAGAKKKIEKAGGKVVIVTSPAAKAEVKSASKAVAKPAPATKAPAKAAAPKAAAAKTAAKPAAKTTIKTPAKPAVKK